jgi:DNA-3-methyladenine glycosylase
MEQLLPEEFYRRDPVVVARELLGMKIRRREADGSYSTVMIAMTEAYAQTDPASHSYRGVTPRTQVMFDSPGLAYVYLIYGMYHCFNVVCEEKGTGAAVLIRAATPETGVRRMCERRGIPVTDADARSDSVLIEKYEKKIASGPGKLCQALAITLQEHNNTNIYNYSSAVTIAAGEAISDEEVVTGSRIGISEARERPWRFGTAGNRSLSPHRFEIADA